MAGPTWLRLACLAATGVFALAVPILGAIDQVSDNPFEAQWGHLDATHVFWAGVGLALIGFVGQTLYDSFRTKDKEKNLKSKACDTVMISGLALLFASAAWTLIAAYSDPSDAMASTDSLTKHLFTGMYTVFGAVALGSVVSETVSACGKERDSIRGRFYA